MSVRGIESSSANLFIIFKGGSKGPGDLLTLICCSFLMTTFLDTIGSFKS